MGELGLLVPPLFVVDLPMTVGDRGPIRTVPAPVTLEPMKPALADDALRLPGIPQPQPPVGLQHVTHRLEFVPGQPVVFLHCQVAATGSNILRTDRSPIPDHRGGLHYQPFVFAQ